jgi:hypothetical protein
MPLRQVPSGRMRRIAAEGPPLLGIAMARGSPDGTGVSSGGAGPPPM